MGDTVCVHVGAIPQQGNLINLNHKLLLSLPSSTRPATATSCTFHANPQITVGGGRGGGGGLGALHTCSTNLRTK